MKKRNVGRPRGGNPAETRQEILKAAIADGILDTAATNAQTYLHWFFETLDYKQINFVPPMP